MNGYGQDSDRRARPQAGFRRHSGRIADGFGRRLPRGARAKMLPSTPACRRLSECGGSGGPAECRQHISRNRQNLLQGATFRLPNVRRSRSCARRVTAYEPLRVILVAPHPRFSRTPAQCGTPPRRSGIPSDDGSMARGSIRPTPKAGEVGGQPDPAGLCARQACRYDRHSGRDAYRRPEGCVEGASGRASAEPALGNGVEPGTDFSPSSARLSRG